ncbi:hypothetical protein SHIRM173S_12390 [Streptomyces hirsutus]
MRVREIDDDEGRRLLRIIRRGSGSVVTWRRAQMVLLSAQGMPVAKIAEVTFTSPDRVRDVIHDFNADGFQALYPKYKGGRPRTFTLPERREIKKISKSRPAEHGLPFSAWQREPTDFLGVDLGIVNIATTSDGKLHAGRELNRYRKRQLALRAKLQKKGTKSAKRVLKRQRRKEQRKATETNHIISKRIVTEAERTGRGIGMEDLAGIRQRVRLRKPQRVALHSWAFAQLGRFVEYKARRAGVPVLFVDPAYTSRMCAECGYTDKLNRLSQRRFACQSCGFVDHADRNASRNIRARAWQLWRSGAESHAPAPT